MASWFAGVRSTLFGPGMLYCIASLVLGIELNLVGPTASSLSEQVGATEAALGPVVGLGGIGLLVGGLPAGWLLDKLPGHAVIASATTLQALAFLLLPHCGQLPALAATYAVAALTFNAITTGSNALILWRYPATHGAWLNLSSALFGVGCFMAPVLAELAMRHSQQQQHRDGDTDPAAAAVPGLVALLDSGSYGRRLMQGDGAIDGAKERVEFAGGLFVLEGGSAALAYYAVAAGAAACTLWALLLPSPPRPSQHHHHHHHHADALEAGCGSAAAGSAHKTAAVPVSDAEGKPDVDGCFSGSLTSVLDLTGIETGSEDSPRRVPATSRPQGPRLTTSAAAPLFPPPPGTPPPLPTLVPAPVAAAAVAPARGAAAAALYSATTALPTPPPPPRSPPPPPLRALAPTSSALPSSPPPLPARPQTAAAPLAAPPPPSLPPTASATGAAAAAPVGFGSTFSTSPAAGLVEPAARAAAAAAATGTPLYGHVAEEDGEDCQLRVVPVVDQDTTCRGGQPKLGKGPKAVTFAAAASAAGKQAGSAGHVVGKAATEEERIPLLQASSDGDSGGSGGGHNGHSGHHGHHRRVGLFQRYAHELAQGWPVLAPVTLLLFANISVQASFGAWITTYCRRAAGLDDTAAQGVTAAYWAAFTATRLAGVGVARFMHAGSVLLVTSPCAVAGGLLAVLGLPAGAGSASHAFAAGLPPWALYTVVALVGVGCATGFANTISLTSDHLQLDGFTNGILSSVAGLASTLCPAAVPWLAERTGLGYGVLMAVVLVMSVAQLAMVGCAQLGAVWVDEWRRREEEAEGSESGSESEGEEAGREGRRSGRAGRGGELGAPLLVVVQGEAVQ